MEFDGYWRHPSWICCLLVTSWSLIATVLLSKPVAPVLHTGEQGSSPLQVVREQLYFSLMELS